MLAELALFDARKRSADSEAFRRARLSRSGPRSRLLPRPRRARTCHAGEAKARSTLDAVGAFAREFEPVQVLFHRVERIVADLVRTPQAGQRPAGRLDCAMPQCVVCDSYLPIIGPGDLPQSLPVLGPERLGRR